MEVIWVGVGIVEEDDTVDEEDVVDEKAIEDTSI